MEFSKELLDNQDTYELLLRHLIRSPQVMDEARRWKFQADDMLTSTATGIEIYREFADVALKVGRAPISKGVLKLELVERKKSGLLGAYSFNDLQELVSFIYQDDLNVEYMMQLLPAFIKRRRSQKALLDNGDDPDAIYTELNELAWAMKAVEVETRTTSVSPFAAAPVKTVFRGVPTSFDKIDATMKGLGYGEYGMIIGHSGAGKTALANNLFLNAVLAGKKALYISLEEKADDVTDRIYAQYFKMDYTELHTRSSNMEIDQKLGEMDGDKRELWAANMRIEDMRELCPVNKDMIIAKLEQLAAEGFIPEVVFIDQLDYIEPVGEVDARWEKYEVASFDMDLLSHYKIDGQHNFALWVLHQAAGAMKLVYTNADIASCKGVIKPADTVMCLGKEAPTADMVQIFTLKSRHSPNFAFMFQFNGSHMTFTWTPHAKVEQKKTETARRKRAGGGVESSESDKTEQQGNPMLQEDPT